MANAMAGRARYGSGGVYQAFGLCIRSALPLPELPAAEAGAAVDVSVRLKPAPSFLPGAIEAEPFIETAPGACLVKTPVGRMLVSNGATIDLDPATDADPADLRPYVFGSGLAILCHQRGVLPLHASAVMAGGAAIAFAGPSGAGKSTLAAALAQAGFPVLCDDLCAVRVEAGEAVVQPGVTRLKLWPDSVEALGLDLAGLEPVAGLGKYALPAPRVERPAGRPLPLGALYALSLAADGRGLRRLRGPEAVSAILAGVHRWPTARALGLADAVFRRVVALAGALPVFDAPDPLIPAQPGARLPTIMASLRRIV